MVRSQKRGSILAMKMKNIGTKCMAKNASYPIKASLHFVSQHLKPVNYSSKKKQESERERSFYHQYQIFIFKLFDELHI